MRTLSQTSGLKHHVKTITPEAIQAGAIGPEDLRLNVFVELEWYAYADAMAIAGSMLHGATASLERKPRVIVQVSL